MDFYYIPLSPPCRAVMLTAKALGVEMNLKFLNVMAGDQMKPEFLAINPQHTVPTFVDGDLKLWESFDNFHYLHNNYGENGFFFNKTSKRNVQMQYIHYYAIIGPIYMRIDSSYPVMFRGQETPDPKKLESFHEALGWLDSWLAGKKYAIGNQVTIADHTLVGTLSGVEIAGDYLSKHKNIVAWMERCKKLPGYDVACAPGAKEFGEFAKKALSK
ncbi:unnamed protein product, partial [Meganyctiphanes norvegica]